ncbi:alpha/beta fold hydrolase [Glycomyces sp. NPDC047010]|uniref:alpha/beta fold hydrolase n=1 Tax=Glycomyces sp. NPDC047010 TaxID=3155023 RepID=UPI0033F4BC74
MNQDQSPPPTPTGYAENGGVRIAYEDLGGAGGEPLLLVMGAAVTRFWWPDGFVEALIDRGFHVAAFDNRDSGQSTHFPASPAKPVTALFRKEVPAYTGEDVADDAVAVLDALGWESAHLFGHSNGNLRAQRIALRHPARVRSLALSAGVSSDAGRLKLLRYIHFGFVAKMARLRFPDTPEGGLAMSLAVSRSLASPGFPFDEEEARSRIRKDEHSPVRDPNTMGRQLGAHWSGPALDSIRVPTVVLHGDSDQLLRTTAAKDLAAAIPGARLVVTPGVGHDLPGPMYAVYAEEVRRNADAARSHAALPSGRPEIGLSEPIAAQLHSTSRPNYDIISIGSVCPARPNPGQAARERTDDLTNRQDGTRSRKGLMFTAAFAAAALVPAGIALADGDAELDADEGAAATAIEQHGQLSVCGTTLCGETGEPVQLTGMSTHGLQWHGDCVNDASLDALATDWNADIVRISMYVQEGGYETDPAGYTARVSGLIDDVTSRGMYALVDWHILTPGDPNVNLEAAQTFFAEIAAAHANNSGVLYETANEPNGVAWPQIKSYHEQVVPVIREHDPDSVIILGTAGYSSLGINEGGSAADIIADPVEAENIMYAFHFYAASHREPYIEAVDRAADQLPIFATEWGTQTYTGDGENDFAMSQQWVDMMAENKISWTNWNFADDWRSGSVYTEGTCPDGPYTGTTNLKPAGVWIRDQIRAT